MSTVALKPVVAPRASEAIYEQIRGMILNGELKPGDHLPSERQMMEMMQRSRPTIREALRMLEREGFIKTSHGSTGAVIQSPTTSTLEQSFEAMLRVNRITVREIGEYRDFNEIQIAGWAAERRTEEDIKNLQQCLQKSAQVIDNYLLFIEAEQPFHALLAKASQNTVAQIQERVLSSCVKQPLYDTFVELSPDDRRALCEHIHRKHVAVVDAIIAQDVETARQRMAIHVIPFISDDLIVLD